MRTLLVALLILVAAAPAAAAPKVVRLTDGPPIATDGKRFAVEPQGARVLVVDTRNGSRFMLERPAPNCSFQAAGGGHLLWECWLPGYRAEPRMIDLVSRKEVEVGGREQYVRLSNASGTNGRGITRLSLGAHWMAGTAEPNYHGEYYFHLNWRTGKRRKVLGGARDVEDLDRPAGHRPLCAPARRFYQWRGTVNTGYEPPWSGMAAVGRWTLGYEGLRRCGSRRTIRVGGRALLTARHMVTLDRRTVTVRALKSGREWTRRLSMRDSINATMSATNNRVYVDEGADVVSRRWRIDL